MTRCIAVCILALSFLGCAQVKGLIKDSVPDTQPAPIPENKDAIDVNAIHWAGENYAGAEIKATLVSAWMDQHKLVYGAPAPSHWPKMTLNRGTPKEALVQGIACLFYHRNNVIFGGKFDWLRPGQTHKGLENVKEGYRGHDMPPGTRAYTCIVSIDGQQRSNIVEVDIR